MAGERHGHGMLCVNPPLGMGLRPLACWDCGFESLREYGFLCYVNVVFVQIEFSVTGQSLVQRSSTEYGCVFECDQKQ
jgi:hypothetical protein